MNDGANGVGRSSEFRQGPVVRRRTVGHLTASGRTKRARQRPGMGSGAEMS